MIRPRALPAEVGDGGPGEAERAAGVHRHHGLVVVVAELPDHARPAGCPALFTSTSSRPVSRDDPVHDGARPGRCRRRRRPARRRRSPWRSRSTASVVDVDEVDRRPGVPEVRRRVARPTPRAAPVTSDGAPGEVEGEVRHQARPLRRRPTSGGAPGPVDAAPEPGRVDGDDDGEQRGVEQLDPVVGQGGHRDDLGEQGDGRAPPPAARAASRGRRRGRRRRAARPRRRGGAAAARGRGWPTRSCRLSRAPPRAASAPDTVKSPTRVRSTRTPATRLARRSPPTARSSRPEPGEAEHQRREQERCQRDQAARREDAGDGLVDPQDGVEVGVGDAQAPGHRVGQAEQRDVGRERDRHRRDPQAGDQPALDRPDARRRSRPRPARRAAGDDCPVCTASMPPSA